MSDLKSQVLADVKSAMKSGEKEILGVLRLISAAFKQHEVDNFVDDIWQFGQQGRQPP